MVCVDESIPVGVVAVRQVRRIPRNETPAAKMQRIIRAAVVEYAREHPADLLEIVRKEILDKKK